MLKSYTQPPGEQPVRKFVTCQVKAGFEESGWTGMAVVRVVRRVRGRARKEVRCIVVGCWLVGWWVGCGCMEV